MTVYVKVYYQILCKVDVTLRCINTQLTLSSQEMYDHGFSAMEKSHQRSIAEMKATHTQEIDRLRQEKEELLRSEAHDTQAGTCHSVN